MRITELQRDIIKQTVFKYFGAGSELRLFGSRLDDSARGGDIDLYVEPETREVDAIMAAKLDTLLVLHQLLGEQKIDLVINRKVGKMLPIYKFAKEMGVAL
ncbi:MAG: DNA polymerase III subunit beta [Cycloclasticus sp. symbiont of Bathymodiolus heckerae]|nr:MAG: DNA polymerase III subunit beta [Cycloclasticus sp. symbiont of Bathymodiolus heckerae]